MQRAFQVLILSKLSYFQRVRAFVSIERSKRIAAPDAFGLRFHETALGRPHQKKRVDVAVNPLAYAVTSAVLLNSSEPCSSALNRAFLLPGNQAVLHPLVSQVSDP